MIPEPEVRVWNSTTRGLRGLIASTRGARAFGGGRMRSCDVTRGQVVVDFIRKPFIEFIGGRDGCKLSLVKHWCLYKGILSSVWNHSLKGVVSKEGRFRLLLPALARRWRRLLLPL
jgi:hypothetical protein